MSSSSHNTRHQTMSPSDHTHHLTTNIAVILAVLSSAPVLALMLKSLIQCLFRYLRRQRSPNRLPETSAGKMTFRLPAVLPTLVYSTGLKLAGDEAACAICLSEFMNGEGMRVLPRCEHGFHVRCIDVWLAAHSSCPTCRASCLGNPSGKDSGCENSAVAAGNSPEMVTDSSSVP